ncbi:MAG: alpha-amylase family glycosyl hydrolase [Anaerolineaceae bacterium]|nr:alpha-amylase family glycosyl hydrolase [Anaerolineaceae bacterium]
MNTFPHWAQEAIFYHIYPLGACGAPQRNDFSSPAIARLENIRAWLPHLKYLGVNALYLGPVFESSAHGYDTADYYHVDRRLGSDETLATLVDTLHQNGVRVILDGVFNHVGRDFWAFRDVQKNGSNSAYCDWFANLRFEGSSPFGDPFTYEGWNGNYDLVKLNLRHPAVMDHLLGAVRSWEERFHIDGLRLDVADCLDMQFIEALHIFSRELSPDFWLMGEVVHGDYRNWVSPTRLDSVTNYECYKGLYSSFVDKNFFEIAYAFNRQFGPEGMYRNLPLYAFADNHDVNRVASLLTQPAHLFPLYCLLFTMPGVPSIYYGSEFGLTGKRTQNDDSDLRPCLDLAALQQNCPQPHLPAALARLAALRQSLPALKQGDYQQVWVNHEQLIFARSFEGQTVYVAINAAEQPVEVQFDLFQPADSLQDKLNGGEQVSVQNKHCHITLPPCWARVLV